MPIRPPAIGVTLGEESGIGPEVVTRALAALRPRVPVLLCVGRGLRPWARRLADEALDGGLLRLEILEAEHGPAGPPTPPGSSDERSRLRAFGALELLADLAVQRRVGALLTGPVPKAIFAHLPAPFPGQTEYIAARQGCRDFAMLLAGPRLRVAPVTTHVPLREVADRLRTEDIVRVGRATAFELRRSFGIAAPRLCVSGLNPHAGEGGRLGDEEERIIAPAIAALRREGLSAAGPVAVDAAMPAVLSGRFDAVLCMYHDQALGPLKAVHFGEAINFTCGLPVPRLSPDHGTAYDIAGRDRADPRSTEAALRRALHVVGAPPTPSTPARSDHVSSP